MARSKTMTFARGLKMPLNAVTETFAFLGRRGSGKTYAASRFAEELLDHEAQTIILDPVGNWYGLRLDATGKKAMWDIPVFGGEYGDVPLTKSSGELIARLVVEKDTRFAT